MGPFLGADCCLHLYNTEGRRFLQLRASHRLHMRVPQSRRKPHHWRSACSVRNAGIDAGGALLPRVRDRPRPVPHRLDRRGGRRRRPARAPRPAVAHDRLARQEPGAQVAVAPAQAAAAAGRQPTRVSAGSRRRAQAHLPRDHLDELRRDGARDHRHRRVRAAPGRRPAPPAPRERGPSRAARSRPTPRAPTPSSSSAPTASTTRAPRRSRRRSSAPARSTSPPPPRSTGGLEAAGHGPERGHGLRHLALLLGGHGRRAEAGERGPGQEPGLPDCPPQQGHLPPDRLTGRPRTADRRPRPTPCWRRPRRSSRRRCPSIPDRAPARRRPTNLKDPLSLARRGYA